MGWKYLDISVLREIDLFEDLEEATLFKILEIMKTQRLKTSQPVFREGDEGNALYLILDGEVRISKNIYGVGEEALAILPAGSYFGEMALLEDRVERSASAIANEDTHLAKLERADFLELLEGDRDVAVEILWEFTRTLSRRLRDSNDRVAFFAMSDMFERGGPPQE
jgi:CRP-like cAMP-binding protein